MLPIDSTVWGNGYNTLKFGEGIVMENIYTETSVYEGTKVDRFYIGSKNSYVEVAGINEVVFADGTTMTFTEFLKAAIHADKHHSSEQSFRISEIVCKTHVFAPFLK